MTSRRYGRAWQRYSARRATPLPPSPIPIAACAALPMRSTCRTSATAPARAAEAWVLAQRRVKAQIYVELGRPAFVVALPKKTRMARPVHPDKDIEAAVRFAEANGWHYEPSSGHPWGRLLCQGAQRGACMMSVWSTPRNPYFHARLIRRRVNACPHKIGAGP